MQATHGGFNIRFAIAAVVCVDFGPEAIARAVGNNVLAVAVPVFVDITQGLRPTLESEAAFFTTEGGNVSNRKLGECPTSEFRTWRAFQRFGGCEQYL